MNFILISLLLFFSSFVTFVSSDPSKILPCFQPYPIGGAQPLTAIYYTTLYDCLMSCLGDTNGCLSVVWDERGHNCYIFGTTAKTDPAILLNKYGTVYYERQANAPQQCGTTPVSITTPGIPTAPGDGLTYMVIPGVTLPTSLPTGVLTNIADENTCISACTNQAGGGKTIGCTSFTSTRPGSGNSNNVTCTFTSNSAIINDTGRLTPDPNSFVFQKFCLDSNAPPSCAEAFFFVLPQTSIPEHTVGSNKAANLADCANQCVANAKCVSSIFDSGTSLCILKDIKTTQPGGAGSNPNHFNVENGCLRAAANQAGAGPFNPAGRVALAQFAQRFKFIKSQKARTFDPDFFTDSAITELFERTTIGAEAELVRIVDDEEESSNKSRAINKANEKSTDKTSGGSTDKATEQLITTQFVVTTIDTDADLIPLVDDDEETGTTDKTTTVSEKIDNRVSKAWTVWSSCSFNVGGRRSRVRTRNCPSFAKCPDKDIEFEICNV